MMTSEVPPIPECLSQLIVQDATCSDILSGLPGNGNSEESGFGSGELGLQDITIQSDEDFPPALPDTGSQVALTLKSQDTLKEMASQSVPAFTRESNKFHSTLAKLAKEMQDLRFLDMSVMYQLSSLHSSIQEHKLNMADRFSETGSEYSLGTASYMGSMSSLNEDWLEEEKEAASMTPTPTGQGRESCANASNLLQQITNLTLRAEEDF